MNQRLLWALSLIIFGALISMCKSVDMPQENSFSFTKLDSLWRAYDSLDTRAYPETAENQLKLIENAALKLGSEPHRMGAVFCRYNLIIDRAQFGELDEEAGIEYLWNKEIDGGLVSQHLMSYARAHALSSYYQTKQGLIESRTVVPSLSLDAPIETWTRQQFLEAIFLESERALHVRLKDAKVIDWTPVFDRFEDSTMLVFRPHLFAVVAQSLSRRLSSPFMQSIPLSEHPILKDSVWWSDRQDFVAHDFGYVDEALGRLVQVFQKGLSEIDDPQVLLDIDLSRYSFIHSHGRQVDREEKWEMVLKSFMKTHTAQPGRARIATELVEYFFNQRESRNSAGRSGYVRAMDLIEKESLRERKDVWGDRARRIALEVERPHLSANLESVVLPGQDILISTTYRNLSQLSYRIYEVSPTLLESINRRNANEFERAIQKQKMVNEGRVDLPVDAQYGMQTVEFGVNGLPRGLYVVVLKAQEASFWRQIQVSDLALVRLDENLLVFDRLSGVGVPEAIVDLELVNWKKSSRDTFSVRTNDMGIVELAYDQGVKINRVRKNDRILYPSTTIHQSPSSAPYRDRVEMEMYTDRSIYRPGQNIRFKGVFFRRTDIENEQTVSGLDVEISLMDPNHETVQKSKVTTDAFGSVSGDFRLPLGIMPGTYLLRTPFGSHSIEVAEYRRPGFELSTKWPEGAQFIAGDTVKLELLAESYSGFPLTDATVQLTVYRSYAPLWRYGIWPPHREQKQLVHESQLTLKSNGKADIRFATEENVQESMRAQYDITCEVIDAAGETHQITETIRLSSSPYNLSVPMSSRIWAESPPGKPWKVENAMGEPVSATINWKLYRLPDPTQKYVDRYWRAPDSILMDQKEFEAKWPHLLYNMEKEDDGFDGELLKQGQISIEGISTPPDDLFEALSGGRYALRALDEQGKRLAEHRFDYYPTNQQISISDPEILWRNPPTTFEPGEAMGLELILPFDKSRSWIAHKQGKGELKISQGRSVKIDSERNSLGSIRVMAFSVIHNRVYQNDIHIGILRPNKKIEIVDVELKTESRPGQKETYRFKVNHPEDIRLTAAMYDESLDAIHDHKWKRLPLGQENTRINLQAFDFQSHGFRSIRFFDHPRSVNVRSMDWPSFKLRDLPRMRVMSDAVVMESMNAKGRGADEEMQPPQTDMPPPPPEVEEGQISDSEPKIRENLDETVFFMPDIKKASDGYYEISFEMNEALTRWKLLLLAHDKKLASGVFSASVVSKQEVSIRPFFPRILRSGDSIQLSARVESTLDLENAVVSIELQNAISGKEVTRHLLSQPASKTVSVKAGKPLAVSWELVVPEPDWVPALQLISRVKSEKGSDAESHILPVLTNRVLLSDALPMELAENSSGVWDVSGENLNKDIQNGQRVLKYKLDVNLQPVWQAIQALPYLSNPENASIPGKLNVLFANSMGIEVAKSIPGLREQLRAFEKAGKGESPLSQSQDWKNTNLDQSPWVQSARKESAQIANIAKLLDVNRQNYERRRILQDLYNAQNADGGFPWMPGGRSSAYVSQYVCKELLRMKSLNLIEEGEIQPILQRALSYAFNYYEKHIPAQAEGYPGRFSNNFLVYIYYLGAETASDTQIPVWEAWADQKPKLEKYLQSKASSLSMGQQALLGMAWHRTGRKEELNDLIQSWRERARKDAVLGWSWSSQGFFDYFHSRLEAHAMIIELCEKVGDSEMSRGAKKFLLKEKQVQQWGNSKSTAAAVHALLLQGEEDWRNPKAVSWTARGEKSQPDLQIGEAFIQWERTADPDGSFEAPVQRLELENPNPFPIWGSVHVQYSSSLDNVESTGPGPMKVKTNYYLEKSGSEGAELIPVEPQTRLEKGDVLVARVQASVDRSMDFVHIEQFRPSSLEPMIQKSGYEFSEELSFYRSVKDEGTHFFIDHLAEGTHIFEFKERVVHSGTCTGGFTRMESFYAPEFKAHSNGQKIVTNDR